MRLVLESPTTSGQPTPPESTGWIDELTGLDGPELWQRELTKENARNKRYRRTATVAVARISGYAGVTATYGPDAALDAFREACRVIAAETRSSDYAARIGAVGIAVLLIEADETGAANFIDRVRHAFERAIGPGRELTIEFGWASPGPSESLDDAQARALEHLTRRLAEPRPSDDRTPADDDRRDPWWDLEGMAVRAARRKKRIRERLAFGLAAVADVLTAALWVLQLSGMLRVPLPH